jgi:hypothetical protein
MNSTAIGTTGRWRRTAGVIVLADPFPPVLQGETGPGSGGGGSRKRSRPSDQQLELLRQFFGSGAAGARARLADFRVPPGLRSRTLRWYLGIARRALAYPAKATPAAQVVQRLRLQLVDLALRGSH